MIEPNNNLALPWWVLLERTDIPSSPKFYSGAKDSVEAEELAAQAQKANDAKVENAKPRKEPLIRYWAVKNPDKALYEKVMSGELASYLSIHLQELARG